MLNRLLNAIRPFTKTELNQLIFFVTARCNLRCRNCFNWENLNDGEDLTLSEIKKVSENLPKFNVLLISGGEPFLRKDLAEIIKVFHQRNGVVFVGIPTNGTVGKDAVKIIEKLLKIDRGLTISLYFSIDGLKEFQDWSRGVKGSFDKTINLIFETEKFKKDFPNLSININTVISADNLEEIPRFISFVESRMSGVIDGHYFELVRGSPRDPAVKNIDKKKLQEIYRIILNYQKRVYEKRKGNKFFNYFLSRLANSSLHFIYQTQFQNCFNGKPWSMPCLAGKGIIVLGSQGQLSYCELRAPVADLRKENFKVDEFMKSSRGQKELKQIEKDKCFCTHGCFISESMYKSVKVVFNELPSIFIKKLVSDRF